MGSNSELGTDPSWLVGIAVYVGLALAGLSVFLLLQLLLMRVIARREEERTNLFRTLWQPVLAETLFGIPTHVPPLPRADRLNFLIEWNRIFETVHGDVSLRLVDLAMTTKIDEFVGKLVVAGNARKRLLAIVTLGHLRIPGYWPILRAIAENDSPVVSLAAARGLLQMDAAKGVDELLRLYTLRKDWPVHWVAKLLYEVGPDATSIPLAGAVHDAAEAQNLDLLSRLVKLLPTAHAALASPVATFVLETTQDEHVVKDCLRALNDPSGIALARGFLAHPAPHIRMSAVLTLGRLGLPSEVPAVIALLRDAEWWVRYRAAQALVGMPYVGDAELDKVEQDLQGQTGLEVLRHVRAEGRLK